MKNSTRQLSKIMFILVGLFYVSLFDFLSQEATAGCGDGVCEPTETILTCMNDCKDTAWAVNYGYINWHLGGVKLPFFSQAQYAFINKYFPSVEIQLSNNVPAIREAITTELQLYRTINEARANMYFYNVTHINSNENMFLHAYTDIYTGDPNPYPNNRIFNLYDGWLMNGYDFVDSNAPDAQNHWINYFATRAAEDINEYGFDTLRIDSATHDLANGWWCISNYNGQEIKLWPIQEHSSDETSYSDESYTKARYKALEYVKSLLPNKNVIFNCLHDGPHTFPSLGVTDGGMAEGFVYGFDGLAYQGYDIWKAYVDMVETYKNNKRIHLVASLSTTTPDSVLAQRRQMLLGSYLLIKGPSVRLFIGTGEEFDPEAVSDKIFFAPEYVINLGIPKGNYYKAGDLFKRDFENGFVLVNPYTDKGTLTYTLDKEYKSVEGQGVCQVNPDGSITGGSLTYTPVSGTISLPVASAIILLNVTPEESKTWYVRTLGGNYGSEDGTSYENAWNGFGDIVWGQDGVKAGDVLYICDTHKESLRVEASGFSGSEITIRGDLYGHPGLIDVSGTNQACAIGVGNCSYVTFVGIEVTGAKGYPGAGVLVTSWSATTSHIRLEKIKAYNNVNGGIDIGTWSEDYPIEHIYITDCETYDNDRCGINTYGVNEHYIYILRNTSYRNGDGVIWGQGISVQNAKLQSKGADVWIKVAGTETWYTDYEDVIKFTIGRLINDSDNYELSYALDENKLGDRQYHQADDGRLYVRLGQGISPNNKNIIAERGSSSHFYIYDNVVYQNGDGPNGCDGNGVYADWFAKNVEIVGNNIYENDAAGIAMAGSKDVLIAYNLIYKNGVNPLNPEPNGIRIRKGCKSTKVYNNTINDNYEDGIRLTDFGDGIKIKNNILSNQDYGYGIDNEAGERVTNIILSNNCYFQNPSGDANGTGGDGVSFIVADPMFLDEANNHFHLRFASPCIDAGTEVGLIADFDKHPVPIGAYPDIGAYEYIPDVTAPSIPPNLTATVISYSQIDLSWSASTDNTGVTGYRIYRDGMEVATSTATTYSDSGLAPSTTYIYAVSAYDASGNESAQSNPAHATTLTPPNHQPVLSPIGDKTIDEGKTLTIILSATDEDIEDILTYSVVGFPTGSTLNDNIFTWTPDYDQAGTYVVEFFATDSKGVSDSETITITVNNVEQIPAAPSNLSTQSVSRSSIKLTWLDNSTNETGFKIERSERNDRSFGQIATVGANISTFIDTGLTKNKTYYYRVRAYNTAGNSNYSNTASATTLKR